MPDAEKNIMSARDIERALSRIALQILEKNIRVDDLAIIGIHSGGIWPARRIHDTINLREGVDLPFGSLDITLYRDDWSRISQNPVVKKTDIPFSVEDKTLVLVDDVIFTGRTIRAALDAVMDFGRPRQIQLATLIDRGGRELPVQPDYTGMKINITLNEHVNVYMGDDSTRDKVILNSVF